MEIGSYKITKTSICSLRRTEEGIVCRYLSHDRICIIDEEKGFAIELDTYLKYPYLKTLDVNKFKDPSRLADINDGDMVVCFVFHLLEISEQELKKVNGVCKLLQKGTEFPSANEVIDESAYRKMVEGASMPKQLKKVKQKLEKEAKK